MRGLVHIARHNHDVAASCTLHTCPAFDANERRCWCGRPILADTEDWVQPVCIEHFDELSTRRSG